MPELNDQQKMDIIAKRMLRKRPLGQEPTPATKEDYDRKFRIRFDAGNAPVFEEVKEE